MGIPTELQDWDTRLLCLDVAARYTGYAVFLISTGNRKYQIPAMGVIDSQQTLAGTEMDSRARLLLSEALKLKYLHQCNCLILEEPPPTIYGGTGLHANILIGRAASMFKVFSAVYAIVGGCSVSDIYCRTVHPNTWQSALGKKKTVGSKIFSLREANRLLKSINHTRSAKPLKTVEEENIADAINIGYYATLKFCNGEWTVPTNNPSLNDLPVTN